MYVNGKCECKVNHLFAEIFIFYKKNIRKFG